jgi:hypothetical protein
VLQQIRTNKRLSSACHLFVILLPTAEGAVAKSDNLSSIYGSFL